MDEARFVFEFIDKGTAGPGTSKPGSGGMGAPPPPANFDGAPGKAHDNNQRASGPRSTGGGPALSAADVRPGKANPQAPSVLDSLKAVGAAGMSAINARGMDLVNKAAEFGKTGLDAAQQAGKAISDARATNAAAQAAAKAAPLEAAKADAFMGMGSTIGKGAAGAAGTAATTAAASSAGAGASGAGGLAALASNPIGLAVGAAAAAIAIPIAGGVMQQRFTNNTIVDYSERLRDTSPEVAAARAQAEVRQILADMRSAQQTGGIVADSIEARSRIADDLQRAKDAIVRAGGPEINAALDVLSITVDRLATILNAYSQFMEAQQKRFGIDKLFAKLDQIADSLNQDQSLDYITWVEKQPWVTPEGFKFSEGEARVNNVRYRAIPGLEL